MTTYSALGLLARVTPALFPGSNLPGFVTNNIPDIGPLAGPQAPDDDSVFNRRRNILVIGLDRLLEYDFDGPHRTDSIMIATLEPNAKTAAVLSFPRDLLVDITLPGRFPYKDRLNASYNASVFIGTLDPEDFSPRVGAEQLMGDIERNFGIRVDYWVVLDFEGVEKLIDALGGITVTVPPDLAVPRWLYSNAEDPSSAEHLEFPPGRQFMTGYRAVAFGRYRGGSDGDLGRVRRQQLVLEAAFAKVFSGGLLDSPLALWNAYNEIVRTNMTEGEMIGLAPLMREIQGEISTYSLGSQVDGVDTVEVAFYEGKSVLTMNPGNVYTILQQVFLDGTYANSTIEIWDGSGDADGGRASALQGFLAYAHGLPAVYVAPDWPHVVPTSIIQVYGDNRLEMAEDIAGWLGLETSVIVRLENDGAKPDIIIIPGADFEVPDR